MTNSDETTRKFGDEILQNLVAEVGQLRDSVAARNREIRPLGFKCVDEGVSTLESRET
jgi:hypothetical protein